MTALQHRFVTGDARDVLRALPAESVQSCITSPPYYGLRDYGVAGQIGLEPTPDEYIAQMVAVFREVRHVLRADGTVWLNLGDSYATPGGHPGDHYPSNANNISSGSGQRTMPRKRLTPGFKSKDLLMIPARVALALQADGWHLRSQIVWHKPCPMPESVADRPTRAWESVFLLAKRDRYFYDADAVAEPSIHAGEIVKLGPKSLSKGQVAGRGVRASGNGLSDSVTVKETRNLRNVWTMAHTPYRGAHFATMPITLAERCIRAGSRIGDTILDPFGGAGTTALAASHLGRRSVSVELNPAFTALAQARIADSIVRTARPLDDAANSASFGRRREQRVLWTTPRTARPLDDAANSTSFDDAAKAAA